MYRQDCVCVFLIPFSIVHLQTIWSICCAEFSWSLEFSTSIRLSFKNCTFFFMLRIYLRHYIVVNVWNFIIRTYNTSSFHFLSRKKTLRKTSKVEASQRSTVWPILNQKNQSASVRENIWTILSYFTKEKRKRRRWTSCEKWKCTTNS